MISFLWDVLAAASLASVCIFTLMLVCEVVGALRAERRFKRRWSGQQVFIEDELARARRRRDGWGSDAA